MEQARRREPPRDLRSGALDDAWALHRAHFHHGAFVRLWGADPATIVPRPTWPEIRMDLETELAYVRARLGQAPMYCVLNLCRLIYSWETRRVAVSKVATARWARRHLPAAWHPLIAAALRAYRGRGMASDRRLLRRRVGRFYAYAVCRIQAAKAGTRPSRISNRTRSGAIFVRRTGTTGS